MRERPLQTSEAIAQAIYAALFAGKPDERQRTKDEGPGGAGGGAKK